MNREQYEAELKKTNTSSGTFCELHIDSSYPYGDVRRGHYVEAVRLDDHMQCPVCQRLFTYDLIKKLARH